MLMDINELREFLEATEDAHEVRQVLKTYGFLPHKDALPTPQEKERVHKWGSKEEKQHIFAELGWYAQDLAKIGLYEKAIEITQLITDPDIKGQVFCGIASILSESNNIQEAINILKNIDTTLAYYEAFITQISTLIEIAGKCVELNKSSEMSEALLSAEQLIAECNDEDVHKSRFINELAYLYMSTGNKEKAISLWDKYLSIVLSRIKSNKSYFCDMSDLAAVILNIARLGEQEKAKLLIPNVLCANLRTHLNKVLNPK